MRCRSAHRLRQPAASRGAAPAGGGGDAVEHRRLSQRRRRAAGALDGDTAAAALALGDAIEALRDGTLTGLGIAATKRGRRISQNAAAT